MKIRSLDLWSLKVLPVGDDISSTIDTLLLHLILEFTILDRQRTVASRDWSYGAHPSVSL